MQYLRLLTTVILSFILQITEATIPESERNILLSIAEYAHPLLQDPGWTGVVGVECTWYGVTCDENEVHIIKLSLMSEIDEDTRIRIKQDVVQLSALQTLDFNNPQFPEPIPAENPAEESAQQTHIPDH